MERKYLEKELEDYICSHQDAFIDFIKNNIYGKDCDIKFIGRQVRIGDNNITDLVYYYDEEEYVEIPSDNFHIIHRNFIIVELKAKKLEPKDIAQLSRYIEILNRKFLDDDKYDCIDNYIYGLFVSCGCSYLTKNIQMQLRENNIDFIKYDTSMKYQLERYSYRDDYIKEIKLDDRIEILYEE